MDLFSKTHRRPARTKKRAKTEHSLPKYIEQNIRHPLLRLGWTAELNGGIPARLLVRFADL